MPGPDDIKGSHHRPVSPSSPEQGRAVSHGERSRSSAIHSEGQASRELGVPDEYGKRKLPPEFDRGQDSANPESQRVRFTTATPGTFDQIIKECLLHESGEGSTAYAAFQSSPTKPPITPESLAQLDWSRLVNNVKLRYDLNFDRAVRYRPDLNSARGRQRMDLSNAYWKALKAELLMLDLAQIQRQAVNCHQAQEHWRGVARASMKRLPGLLMVVRDILETLVPDSERPEVAARFDMDLIVQQVENGMCDLVDLAKWMAKKLKSHCAPMRDELVNKMQASLTRGAVERKPDLQVVGLCRLLNILEAMKLDLANRQLRHTQSLLVRNTVTFYQRYNRQKISFGQIDARGSQEWLEEEMKYVKFTTGEEPNHLEAVLTSTLRSLLLSPDTASLPPTFHLDLDWLWALRREMHSIICHRICCNILLETIAAGVSRLRLGNAIRALCVALTAMIDATDDWLHHVENIAVEIARAVYMHNGHELSYDSELLSSIQRKLRTDLRPMSVAFCVIAQGMFDCLLPKMKTSVKKHTSSHAIQLQEALLPLSPHAAAGPFCCGVVGQHNHHVPPPMDQDVGIVRRFTHILVLHWQIWADLVYLAPS